MKTECKEQNATAKRLTKKAFQNKGKCHFGKPPYVSQITNYGCKN